MKISALMILLVYVSCVVAEEPLTAVPLALRMESPTLFVDVLAQSVVFAPDKIAWPDELPLPEDTDAISFIRLERTQQTQEPKAGSEWRLSFLPRRPGLVTFPALSWDIEGKCYQTAAQQIHIGSARKEPAMQLEIRPAQTTVTAGEPLRIDIHWHCALPAAELKQLTFNPPFFYQSGIELEIPRPLVPAERQIGLPVGGRRIIAERVAGTKDHLGTVQFPVFIRFTQAGSHAFESSRLELFQLLEAKGQFAPYASYFNNSLFERRDPSSRYDYLFTESLAFEIKVLPLPEIGKDASFSRLFAPCQIETSIQPETGDVGQLMELSVRVYSEAPSGLLALPDLTQQASLRHRFWIESEPRRLWQPDGAEFLFRFRALTTSVRAFPSLTFQIFDPNTGGYRYQQTRAIPLVINEKNGQTFLRRDLLLDENANLTDDPTGIWHNDEANKMSDLMNTLVNALANSFWLGIVLGPLVFIVLRPWVLRRRRRATDPVYSRRIAAYERFRKCPETDENKRVVFRSYLAAISNQFDRAYTVGDALAMMRRYQVRDEDMETVRTLFEAEDSARFNRTKAALTTPALNSLAKRIFRCVDKATKTALMVAAITVVSLTGTAARAAEPLDNENAWRQAERLFAQARQVQEGSPTAMAAYAEAALHFESVAQQDFRPGRARYNAGNAWFEGGQLGRSIAAYLHARAYRPFDAQVKRNLDTARALTLDRVLPGPWRRWLDWPSSWLAALFVILFVVLWAMLLVHLRYRRRWSLVVNTVIVVLLLLCLGLLIKAQYRQGKQGVVVASEIVARKGPGYHYNSAFLEPLHSGLECDRQETRGPWSRISLQDGRECWVPTRQITWIRIR
ncbi:hypothetical protein ACFL6U_16815 [Planctomycetota bacterium]